MTVIAAVFPLLLAGRLEESFPNFILSRLVILICTGITIYYIGSNKAERQFVMNKLYAIKNRLNRK